MIGFVYVKFLLLHPLFAFSLIFNGFRRLLLCAVCVSTGRLGLLLRGDCLFWRMPLYRLSNDTILTLNNL